MATLAPSWIVRAGCTPALSVQRTLDFVRAVRTREPAVTVHVSHLASPDQLERLRSGDLDLAIVVDPDEQEDLMFEPLFAGEALAACLAADHPLAERETIHPSDLYAETLVTGSSAVNPPVYKRTLAHFGDAGYRFRQVEETEGATARELVFAAASGRGVAFLPTSLENLIEASDEVVLRPLDPVVRMPSSFLGWRTSASPGLIPVLGIMRAVARELFESIDVQKSRPHPSGLTARQLDVLCLLAEGRSTSEIACELGLSQATVRNHIAALIAALGVHTRLQAVIAAKRKGLLEL